MGKLDAKTTIVTGGARGIGLAIAKRSNSISQAVIDVRGRAAAEAKSSDFGLRPTMRSSTR